MQAALTHPQLWRMRTLDKDYRQTVYLNDPKGVFVLRWYKEVTKDGSDVAGGRYQNKHCAAYKLTRDNDGAAFVYTSNVQLTSKVYLQKTSQPDVCTLSKKDKKMLLEGMRRMVAPEGGEGPLG